MNEKKLCYNISDSGQVYLLALVVPLALEMLIALFIQTTPVGPDGKHTILTETWFLCTYRALLALIAVAIFFLVNKSKNISNYACGIKGKTNSKNVLICLLIIPIMVFLTSDVITLFSYGLTFLGIKADTGIGFALNGFGDLMLALLFLAVLPAVTEELLFRGVIFNGLKKMGKWKAILISALAFCLMHANIPQFPYTFLLGVVLGFVMWHTRSLWLCMLMHFLNNALVIITMFAQGNKSLQEEVDGMIIWLAILLFVLAAFLVFGFFVMMERLNKNKQNDLAKSCDEPLKENAQNAENAQAGQFVATKTSKRLAVVDFSWLIVGFVVAVFLTVINTV